MSTVTAPIDSSVPFNAKVSVEKMPAHWLMGRLGKRVLRPGGRETTRWLIEDLRVSPQDRVVELAPGLGATARELLACGPASYVGVERDMGAAEFCERGLRQSGYGEARVLRGDASSVPLPDGSASVVFAEAMLSMQPTDRKRAIVAEAKRLLEPGGRYAIHELAVSPETIDRNTLERIQTDLSKSIHVGVRIGTVPEWTSWLANEGLIVESTLTAPMRLLEPDRLLADEGAAGLARFVYNTLRTPGAAKRLMEVRSVFRKHALHLIAVALIARRPKAGETVAAR